MRNLKTIEYMVDTLPEYYKNYSEIGVDNNGIVKWIAYGNPADPFTQQDVFEHHQQIADDYISTFLADLSQRVPEVAEGDV